jgi:hypothetical protein
MRVYIPVCTGARTVQGSCIAHRRLRLLFGDLVPLLRASACAPPRPPHRDLLPAHHVATCIHRVVVVRDQAKVLFDVENKPTILRYTSTTDLYDLPDVRQTSNDNNGFIDLIGSAPRVWSCDAG